MNRKDIISLNLGCLALKIYTFASRQNEKNYYLVRYYSVIHGTHKAFPESKLFWNPPRKYLGFVLYPWRFQIKQTFTPRNSTKLLHVSEKFWGLKPRSLCFWPKTTPPLCISSIALKFHTLTSLTHVCLHFLE